jgi:hypothetical protein
VVYTVTATDNVAVTSYAFGGGTDDAAFSIDSATGAVTLTANPDYETKSSYSFNVVALDAVGNSSASLTVSLAINDLDDKVPVITSSATATAIDENSGVYTVTAIDYEAVTSFAFGGGTDDAAFSIDSTTGVVTLTANPDYEMKSSYSFDVVAQDAVGNVSTPQTVILNINNVIEVSDIVAASTNPASGGTPSISDLIAVGVINTINTFDYQEAYEEAIADAVPAPTTVSDLQAIIDMVNQTLNIEVYERFNFDISPNPVQNKMNIYFSDNKNDIDVSIYDLTGRRVFYKPSYKMGILP